MTGEHLYDPGQNHNNHECHGADVSTPAVQVDLDALLGYPFSSSRKPKPAILREDGVAVVLGSGFSKWAVDLPIAGGLFDFCVKPWGSREKKRLDRIGELKAWWDSLHPNEHAEAFISYALDKGDDAASDTMWYIARRLSEPFIQTERYGGRNRRHVLMIDDDRALSVPGVAKARSFLAEVGALGRGIITTNYDLLAEYCLGTKGFNYGSIREVLKGPNRYPYPFVGWRRPVALTGSIPIAKVHGSISWDAHGFYSDGRRGITGNALMVAPTQGKTIPSLLMPIWDLAASIVTGARRAMLFGCGLNVYDEEFLTLLKRGHPTLESVLVVDVDPKIDRVKQLWPNADITESKPPPDGGPMIDAWLSGSDFRPGHDERGLYQGDACDEG